MTDISSATYSPPGVYVTDESTPTVAPRSVSTTTVTLVGPALGYQTLSEVLTVYSGSGTNLSKTGVYATAVTGPPAIAAPVVTKLDGTALVYNTDYTFVVVTGSGGAASATTQIKRLSSNVSDLTLPSPAGLVDGNQVRITYQFTGPSYYDPTEFEDYDQVVATYGAALVSVAPASPTATQVASPLTLAAKIALENGAATVLCVATNPADGDYRTQLSRAYTKLQTNYLAQIIVPLWPTSTGYDTTTSTNAALLLADIKLHCETAAADGFGRIGFCGLPTGYSNTATHDQLALAVTSKRVVLAYANRLLLFNSAVNASTEVDGFYLAAAMAGRLAINPVNRGLTNKTLTSFSGLPAAISQAMTTSFMNTLSKSGVSVATINDSGQLIVRHGVTTNVSTTYTREISLVRIGDTLLQMVASGMTGSGLIGEPIDANMTMNVKAAVAGILEQAVSDAVIVSYANLAVKQQSTDPSIIEATFSYKPAVPLNYIVVKFSVDLTTGDTTTTEDTTATA